MPRTVTVKGKTFVVPLHFCDEDCNNCEVIRNRQFSLLINILRERFGEEVYDITQLVCPNMTCCADCCIDDFCHEKGCEIVEEAEALVAAWGGRSDADGDVEDGGAGREGLAGVPGLGGASVEVEPEEPYWPMMGRE